MAVKMNKVAKLFFSSKIYSAESVKLAAYIFEDRADIEITEEDKGISVLFSAADSAGFAAGDFANEVLNQQCRIDLAGQNARITNMIVSRALLSAMGKE